MGSEWLGVVVGVVALAFYRPIGRFVSDSQRRKQYFRIGLLIAIGINLLAVLALRTVGGALATTMQLLGVLALVGAFVGSSMLAGFHDDRDEAARF